MPYDEHGNPLAQGFYELDLADTWCPTAVKPGEKDHEYGFLIVKNDLEANDIIFTSDVGTVK
jgi:hypothetical protein